MVIKSNFTELKKKDDEINNFKLDSKQLRLNIMYLIIQSEIHNLLMVVSIKVK